MLHKCPVSLTYKSMKVSVLGDQAIAGKTIALGERRKVSMLACNRLRIDPGDGSPVVDYRIENGCVESRSLETATEWHRLTPDELSSHVMAETVVAQWLHRRMGDRRLIRACAPSTNNDVQGYSERIAA
jgi:hypothetical protein